MRLTRDTLGQFNEVQDSVQRDFTTIQRALDDIQGQLITLGSRLTTLENTVALGRSVVRPNSTVAVSKTQNGSPAVPFGSNTGLQVAGLRVATVILGAGDIIGLASVPRVVIPPQGVLIVPIAVQFRAFKYSLPFPTFSGGFPNGNTGWYICYSTKPTLNLHTTQGLGLANSGKITSTAITPVNIDDTADYFNGVSGISVTTQADLSGQTPPTTYTEVAVSVVYFTLGGVIGS